jgi:hypothetical protein
MKLIDQTHPFYQPLWRRIVIVATVAIWALLEILSADPLWIILACALLVYSIWALLVTWPKTPTP